MMLQHSHVASIRSGLSRLKDRAARKCTAGSPLAMTLSKACLKRNPGLQVNYKALCYYYFTGHSPTSYPNRVSLRLFRSRMRAKAAAVIRAVSTPRTTGTQDVRLWGGPCLPVRGKGNAMSQAYAKMSFKNFPRMATSPSLAKRFPKPSKVANQKDLKDSRV